jgi:hypothetical protein
MYYQLFCRWRHLRTAETIEICVCTCAELDTSAALCSARAATHGCAAPRICNFAETRAVAVHQVVQSQSTAAARRNYQIELMNLFPFTRAAKNTQGLDATSATPELRQLHISAEKRRYVSINNFVS